MEANLLLGDADGNNNDNIIRTSEPEYILNGGLGSEFFRFMQFYKNDVAQYIVDTEEIDTFGALLKRCIRTSLKMQSNEISQDDIVCLCTYNHINSCVPFISSAFLGIKVACLDPTLSIKDVSYLLKQVKPSIIFLVPESIDLIETSLQQAEIHSKLVIFGESEKYEEFSDYLEYSKDEDDFKPIITSPKDTAAIFFSSGTTGLPKGICKNGYALLSQAVNLINNRAITSVTLSYSSLYWISAALFLAGSILSGTARVVCKSFNPRKVWSIIDKYSVSYLFLAPNQAFEMYKIGRPDAIDTSSLLCLMTGGGIFPEKQISLLRDLLPGTFVCQVYGQTEAAGLLTCFNMNDVKDTLLLHYKPRSCGKPVTGIWYKVVDPETERILGPHKQGELRIKTEFIMNGYYQKDSSESYDSDGWLKTGDIVYYDEDECFYVVDRIKEMLKYKSWHIAPAMLELILNDHPAIKKAIVIGIPHEEDGDHPMAVVMLEENSESVTGDEIEKYLADRVQERQKLRAGVKFIKNIPLTPSGKIKRQDIKKMVLAGEI